MPDELSKSALKREAERLQKIGLKLTQLKPDTRARLQLPDALRKAIDVHAGINSREGSRRQISALNFMWPLGTGFNALQATGDSVVHSLIIAGLEV